MFTKADWLKSTKFNDFCRIILLRKWLEKLSKGGEHDGTLQEYRYRDDGGPVERQGSEAVLETIAVKRPLVNNECNPCEMAHGNHLDLFPSKVRCLGKLTSCLKFDLLQKITEIVVQCSCLVKKTTDCHCGYERRFHYHTNEFCAALNKMQSTLLAVSFQNFW